MVQHTGSTNEDEVDDFQPLTPEQVRAWRARQPRFAVWRIVWVQSAVAVIVAAVAWLVSGRVALAWSAGYGGFAVVLPALLFVRAMARQYSNANAALVAVFVSEIVKVTLTISLLLVAPKLVPQLSWPALLTGFVVTIKTYWIALLAQPRIRKTF